MRMFEFAAIVGVLAILSVEVEGGNNGLLDLGGLLKVREIKWG